MFLLTSDWENFFSPLGSVEGKSGDDELFLKKTNKVLKIAHGELFEFKTL